MRRVFLIFLLNGWLLPAMAVVVIQNDWSGGPGSPGPVDDWDSAFHKQRQISWRAQAGQINLAGEVLSSPVANLIAGGADQLNTIAVADMDADSLDDVVGADPVYDVLGKRGAVYRWTQENGQWLRYVIDADFYGANFVDTVDLDQDGDLDVIVSAYYGESYQLPPQAQGRNGRYAWIENLDGMGGSWQTHIIGELFWGAESLQAGDIDGDGDLDLVGTSSLTDGPYVQQSDLTWFENTDGNGMTWQQHDIDSSYEPYSTLALLRDMDQDGDLDLVTTRREQLDIRWNDQGDGSQWTRKAILVCIGCVPYADIADVDGDGEIDLLASSFSYTGNSQALWFQNLGKGLGWQQYTVQTGLGNWKPGLPAAT